MLPEISDLSTAIDCSSLSFVPCICMHFATFTYLIYRYSIYRLSIIIYRQSIYVNHFCNFFLYAPSISLMLNPFPSRRYVALLPQYGHILAYWTVEYVFPQSSHTVTPGMISVLNSESFKSPDFFLAYPQQSVRYSGTTPLTSPISQVTDLISVFFIKM